MKRFSKGFISMLLVVAIVLSAIVVPTKAGATIKQGLNKSKLNMYVGNTEQLKLNGANGKVTWSSSKKTVATVSSKGKVTAKKAGKTVIAAKISNKKYSCKITVKELTLAGLEKYLKDKKVIKGDSTELLASMVGADKAVKYKDSGVELYEYDVTTDAYKKLVETKKMYIEDFDMHVDIGAVNGKFVILFSDGKINQDILDAFNNFK